MNIISRAEWGALSPREPLTAWNTNNLQGVCVHHFAIPRSAATADGSDDLMRSVQRFHRGTVQAPGEFIDIAYNHCFDKFGQIFEGRGFGFQTGANGDQTVNKTHAAICYMGHSDEDGLPDIAQKAAAWLLKQWFNRGVGVQVVPHSQLSPTGTSCPGDRARAWVSSGAWRADLPLTRRVQYLLVDDGKIIDRSMRVPMSESAARLNTFLNSDAQVTMHRRLVAEGSLGRIQVVRKVTVV